MTVSRGYALEECLVESHLSSAILLREIDSDDRFRAALPVRELPGMGKDKPARWKHFQIFAADPMFLTVWAIRQAR